MRCYHHFRPWAFHFFFFFFLGRSPGESIIAFHREINRVVRRTAATLVHNIVRRLNNCNIYIYVCMCVCVCRVKWLQNFLVSRAAALRALSHSGRFRASPHFPSELNEISRVSVIVDPRWSRPGLVLVGARANRPQASQTKSMALRTAP